MRRRVTPRRRVARRIVFGRRMRRRRRAGCGFIFIAGLLLFVLISLMYLGHFR